MDNYRVINTKISELAFKELSKVCRKRGATIYDLLQLMCETFIRFMSEKQNLTPDMEKLMEMFEQTEDAKGWKNVLNLCDPEADTEIVGAIYLLQGKGKSGIRPVYVEKPFMGQWTQTENVKDIVERFFNYVNPGLYMRLRKLAVEMDCNSIFECIWELTAMYGREAFDMALRAEFMDANRNEYGLQPHEGTPFRRKQHKDVDTQTSIDFRPHGGEW